MKKFRHILAVVATASAIALLTSSCWGWYDWDSPGPPPHHHHHGRPHHGPHHGPGRY